MTGGTVDDRPPHLLDGSYSDLWGFRFWALNVAPPRLLAPLRQQWGAPIRNPRRRDHITSICPSMACVARFSPRCGTCGIYYIPEQYAAEYYIVEVRTNPGHEFPERWAVTFGKATGDVAADPLWELSKRASGYRIGEVAVPVAHADVAEAISAEYGGVRCGTFGPLTLHETLTGFYERARIELEGYATPYDYEIARGAI